MKALKCKRGKVGGKVTASLPKRGHKPLSMRLTMYYGAFWSDGLSPLSRLSVLTRSKAVAMGLAAPRHGFVTACKVRGLVGAGTVMAGAMVADYRTAAAEVL